MKFPEIKTYINGSDMPKRCCCNCGHRVYTEHCDLDGHYISYLACFKIWCRHWKKWRKDAE